MCGGLRLCSAEPKDLNMNRMLPSQTRLAGSLIDLQGDPYTQRKGLSRWDLIILIEIIILAVIIAYYLFTH